MQILRPESERLKQNLEGVCLHSYNDTVNANTEVIIEHYFRRFSSFRLCSKNSVNATSVTKSEISRFRSRRPLPPDPYCSAPTQPPPLAATWSWQVIGKNAKLNRRRDTFVSEISEFRHRRRDEYSIFTDVLSRRASIEPAGALSIEPAGAYVPDSLPGYMIASSAQTAPQFFTGIVHFFVSS